MHVSAGGVYPLITCKKNQIRLGFPGRIFFVMAMLIFYGIDLSGRCRQQHTIFQGGHFALSVSTPRSVGSAALRRLAAG